MSPLRKQLEDDLAIRGMSERTRESLRRRGSGAGQALRPFARPDRPGRDSALSPAPAHRAQARPEQLQRRGERVQFFYRVTLKRTAAEFALPRPKQPQKLPQILAREEVARLLAASENPKHRAMLMTAYGAGLRVSELCHLKVGDIDSARMTIRVEQGKGAKDRYTLLPERLLAELRRYWLGYRPKHWLFVGERCAGEERPIAVITAQRIYRSAKARAGITKHGGIHALRHAFATHLLEAGVDVHTIQRLMGHGHIGSTLRYFHLADRHLAATPSPLELLEPDRAHTAYSVVRAPAHGARGAVRVELADIVRAHAPALLASTRLARVQRRALRAIERCRTAALGGQISQCDHCGRARYVYHSCRNRHCPKCQTLAKERWLAARRAELLPVPYFHLVFTLPHELNRPRPGQPARALHDALRRRLPDPARVRRQPALARRPDRRLPRAAHLGSDPHPAPARPRPGRRRRTRSRRSMDLATARLPLPRQSALEGLPRQIPRRPMRYVR